MQKAVSPSPLSPTSHLLGRGVKRGGKLGEKEKKNIFFIPGVYVNPRVIPGSGVCQGGDSLAESTSGSFLGAQSGKNNSKTTTT